MCWSYPLALLALSPLFATPARSLHWLKWLLGENRGKLALLGFSLRIPSSSALSILMPIPPRSSTCDPACPSRPSNPPDRADEYQPPMRGRLNVRRPVVPDSTSYWPEDEEANAL
ncbi:hypothetical protein C8R46DRAFT_1062233 [Mycena filopes]|nr:hypothetical protein C8R46DRAFT_1062233 [Mycena filopes]